MSDRTEESFPARSGRANDRQTLSDQNRDRDRRRRPRREEEEYVRYMVIRTDGRTEGRSISAVR